MRVAKRQTVKGLWLLAVASAAAVIVSSRILAAPANDPPPEWAFVAMASEFGAVANGDVSAPGSSLRLPADGKPDAYFYGRDWFPQDHAPMPDVVAHGRPPKLSACVECHLPNGVGGPESAVI